MNRLLPPARTYVADSTLEGAGRGVFAATKIANGALIESCPVIALQDPKDRDRLRKTGLVNYYFLWGKRRDHAALCLGWGAVYNHSFAPNARYEKVMEDLRMDFYALRDIEPDEEILVNYNGDPNDTTPLRIPGIPVAAGGMPPSRLPRVLDALVRRARLLARYFSGAPVFLLAGF